MKKFTKLSILLIIFCMSILGTTVAFAEDKPIELHIGCDSPEDTVTYIFLEKFAALLEAKTNGKVVVRRYSNAKLGNDVELIEGVQNGNVTFAVQNTAPQVNFIPELAVFDLPMAFPNIEIARKVMSGKLLEELRKAHAKKNITLLAYADQGFRQMSTNKAVSKLEDLKGQKIRTMSNPNHVAFWKAVGANPTPMTFGEVYISLQQKAIDGQENPLEAIIAAKLHEQQDYIVLTNHFVHALSLIGSPAIIETLPKEVQDAIPLAATEAKEYAYKMTDERAAGRVKIIEDSGTKILAISDELYNQMKEAGKPVYESIEKKIGKDLVDLIQKEVEAAK
ncbi:MAG: TRAP transporter substrate-binding protein [Fusobacteriaceae bacterium]|jgi:tripartite ATP-independent transporter DctP family solute receptor|nr:TRAP transporter substrate-binding protein [Fusobacteriaceae bacterium]